MTQRVRAVLQHAAFPACLAAGLAACTSLWFLGHNPAAELPLDDSYIHLQYAWQAAHGQMLQYNPGDPPTTGATSLWYMLLLAVGFALGLSREAMPGVVLGMSAPAFIATSALVADAARRLAARVGVEGMMVGSLAGLWFAGSGWMAWAFFSGMETGWLIAVVTLALWAAIADRLGLRLAATSLAVLTRPEAALLALAMLFVKTPNSKHRAWLSFLPLGAALIQPLVNWLYTGSPSATGFLAKSWFTLQPAFPLVALQLTGQTFIELLTRLAGTVTADGRWHVFPLLQIWAIVGAWRLWREAESRRFAIIAIVWSAGLLAVTATLQTATWHHHRYQMPAYSALVLLGSLGVGWLASHRLRFIPIIFTFAIAWSGYSLLDFADAYRRDLDTLTRMQRPLAEWLRAHTPAGARIAVHDVGVMRFIGRRDILDVVGLTSPAMAEAYRNGPGALYEALRRERPDYFALYPDAAPPYFGLAHAAELLGKELFRVTMPDYSLYVSAADTQIITRADWSQAPLADSPQQPDIGARIASLTQTDSLNIADLRDERNHNFHWWMVEDLPGFVSDARRMRYRLAPEMALSDGGRGADGGYGFRVAARAGEPLLLVARLHSTGNLRVRVSAGGRDVGEWRLPAIPGEWLESAYLIPAEFITRDSADISLAAQPENAGTRFNLFYVWAYAGERATQPTEPQYQLRAAFGEVAELQGYDLARTTVAPGETFSLTLHWLSLRADESDWRVFVHLTDLRDDTASGIRAQSDAAPRAGTYPFWVWGEGERVSETITLTVPEDAEPGEHYAVFVGIYDSASGQRAPVAGEARYEGERVLLTPIAIER